MQQPLIFNVQKFSTHDGPGIRTTIFFKGCPIRCQWCHNAESQKFTAERMLDKNGVPQLIGRTYEIDELVKLVAQDQLFYDQSGGGVTFSGGEVMAQPLPYLLALAQGIKRRGIHLAIDTCGVVPQKNLAAILPYADLFLYDLKFIDSQLHQRYTGAGNEKVLDNLKFLSDQGAVIDLRLILLKDLNDTEEMLQRTLAWVQENQIRIARVSLLPYHDFGRDKYRKLGRECTQNFAVPTDERLAAIKAAWEQRGVPVKIGG
ncbi:glycyl-radical enzyme activating protein [Lapidilactobacillus achengensis]|uniref:Glycyl-radical enzyme activating protein n=1 Tax=Lapidilactobacillus achengensis TaxID=2486000 RepID=A0ABW1UP62_9LACO|nr:glycyl-radical enzyme activating protein [Lapidilactobacillus achengensis]